MSFLMKESLSDVVFLVNGHRVPAIKGLLIVKSPVFAAMFSGNFKESKTTEIPIKDTTVDAFKTMIRFIITEQLVLKDNNNIEHIWDVIQLTDRYDVLRLRQRVGQHLESIINIKNLLSISRFAFNHNIEELISKVMAFIEKNIKELIKWDINEVKQLNDETNDKLLDVLRSTLKCNLGQSLNWIKNKNKIVLIKNEVLDKNGVKSRPYLALSVENDGNYFDLLKIFVGLLYSDKLILKDQDDLDLIEDLCLYFYLKLDNELSFDSIEKRLKHRINVKDFERISKISFDYKIDGLIKSVYEINERNLTQITTISDSYSSVEQLDSSTFG